LSTGYYARISSVSASLIEEAQASVEYPEVPKWHDEDRDRWEENPNHPDYIKSVAEVDKRKTMMAIDAMILFGVEIVNEDGTPYDVNTGDKWYQKIRLMAKRKMINVDGVDLDDPLDIEWMFKKYIAVGAPDLERIARASNLSEEDVKEASATFQDNKARNTNRATPD
jgi:hypothetical protein